MKIPLKLNSIDQEHLQELYDAGGVARDELPYTPVYDKIVEGFQDRTFKNADPEQVFGAMLKYMRSSSNAATEPPPSELTDDHLKLLKSFVSRHLVGGKLLPYSDEFSAARAEFNKAAGLDLNPHDFWRGFLRAHGAKRRPPPRKKAVVAVAEESDDDGE